MIWEEISQEPEATPGATKKNSAVFFLIEAQI